MRSYIPDSTTATLRLPLTSFRRGKQDRRLRRLPVLLDLLLGWQERARQRRQLQQLDDRMLRDIGLSRADVAQESEKPFWRV